VKGMTMDEHVVDVMGPGRPRQEGRARLDRFVVAAVIAAFVLVAAGCGDNASDAAEPRDEGEGTTTVLTQEPSPPSTGEQDAGGDADADVSGESEPLVVPSGTSPTAMAGADLVHCIATAEHTGGSYSFLEIHIPAGSGPPPHQHDAADEFFYMLSGTASIETGDVDAEVGPGDYFHVPRGATHSIRAVTDVQLLAGYAPGGDEIVLFGCPG
jgi:quercetin dioxygenase-like cupin family protein